MVDYILLEKYAETKNILFVDDDIQIRKEVGDLLKDIFPSVDIEDNGLNALNKYKNFHQKTGSYYDLIITDIKMPVMDGIEFTKKLYDINPKQIVIVLSAHDESSYLLDLINIGIAQFMVKPINYDKFIHIIFNILNIIEQSNKDSLNEKNPLLKLNESLSWNKDFKILYQDEKVFKLTKKETLLLDLLLKYPEKTYSNEEILNYLWYEEENVPEISNLKNIISRLKKKLSSLSLENIYSFGYRINIE